MASEFVPEYVVVVDILIRDEFKPRLQVSLRLKKRLVSIMAIKIISAITPMAIMRG